MVQTQSYEEDIDSCYEHDQLSYYPLYETENDYPTDEDDSNLPQPLYELPSEPTENEPPIQYTLLRVGITSLLVSTHGMVRNLKDIFNSSMGYAMIGTPYRTYSIEIEKDVYEEYFVHDLIWRAFHGEPPEGWEVRHTYWEAKRGNEFYDNSLEYLALYPSTVIYMPSIRKVFPSAD